MKLTKFVHSCVLVEDGDKAVLFDPGIFSWNSGLINVATLPELDAIVVSHVHPDHCGEPFVRALIKRFPDVQWLAPSDVHETLKQWGAKLVTNTSYGDIQATEVDHALVVPFGVQPCKNLITTWNGLVTHPGDTHEFTETKDVLLLPIQAPWGTTVRALELALELKPKYILPIHDWMWNEEWRQTCYNRFEALFADTDVTFLRPTDGEAIEVELP